MKKFSSCLFFILSAVLVFAQPAVTTLQVPGRGEMCNINLAGPSVLPSGRYVRPAGDVVRLTHDPFGMALSPNGKKAVTLHNGVFTIIDLVSLERTRVPSYNNKIKSPFSNGSFLGVAFGADNKTIYLSGGDNGAVIAYDIEAMETTDSVSLNGTFNGIVYDDSFTSDLLLNSSTNELLVLDRANFRMVRISLSNKKITASIPVGRQPFGIALSPDKKTALVANVGMYSYPLIKGMDSANKDRLMISHHPYGDNTKEAIEGTQVEGKEIPGVGSPHAPEAMSVFVIDLAKNTVTAKLKTGLQIGQMIEEAEVTGGASPNSIAVGSRYAYVTNATNDNIAVIDYRSGKIITHIPITVDKRIDRYRGLLPFGITLSKDEKIIYTALLGFNAVAVIDVATKKTKGLIPTGWGPSRVLLSANQKELYVTSCRGLGAGPNGGKDFMKPVQGTYIGDIQLASFQRIAMPDKARLQRYTQQTIDNTFTTVPVAANDNNPLPPLPGMRQSPVKYIVYITKENRTYDEVFGQMNNGDSSLARFGLGVTIKDKKDSVLMRDADIMPNHIKLAKQFGYSHNFYCDSDASIHGHHWMLGVIPNEWVEANSNVERTAKIFSAAPGRRHPGTTGSMDPEDYAETGGLWEAFERKKVSFYNFGQANETAHVREEWTDTATGAAHSVMVPMQKALFSRTSHNYAGYNTNIPDQFRAEQFETEFTRLWLNGKDTLPSLLAIQLPNDHGAGVRPEDGYPYLHSYMADNDLALGRMLHFLSRTPYWKNMLVIVTEDDPQGGVDHIDAHRSVLMMAGPYIKKNYVSGTHANFGSILKVIYILLNVPYVNQYDVTASLLQDFFTPVPDYTPYTLVKPDERVFDAQKAMNRYNKNVDWRKIMQGPKMDDTEEQRKAHGN
jgi:YVTN family beta-propeller protein